MRCRLGMVYTMKHSTNSMPLAGNEGASDRVEVTTAGDPMICRPSRQGPEQGTAQRSFGHRVGHVVHHGAQRQQHAFG